MLAFYIWGYEDQIHMKLPSENDRFNILEYWIKHTFGQALNGPDIIQISRSISRITPGYTGADIKLVCQKVQIYINRQNEIITQNFANFKKIFTSIIHNTYPSSLQIYSSVLRQNELSLKDIGGLDAIISLLYRAIEWPIKYPEIFNQMGVAQPKGVLLYGPPGCAKTTLACAIAKQINFSFFSISAAELYSPYVGVAEVTLTSLFQQARQNAPSIIFIDEIDAIFGNRSSDNHNEVQNRLLSGLLMEMDGISNKLDSMIGCEVVQSPGIFIIAATNRPEALDSALLRPGRFDQILYVSPPDDKARLEILKKITQKIPLHPNVDINKLVLMTAQYSGADLVKLCKEAVLEAMTTEGLNIHEIKSDFFEKALNKNKPSLTKQQLSWYKKNRV
ncbi:spermatogenesis-associated protein 5-like protein 1 isoform X2 [Ctenocephalides felis]|uniref:spermatogenesis-associated protein 5-like protein 1 isoform X2 n=1 Tax=Ctenocephalides felis TaxID=7515 RepID=UPI000E6E4750|nr:spermatogenesis-associated protein 5-like protein 1 isoform X2 [Ctenocephalides felis]